MNYPFDNRTKETQSLLEGWEHPFKETILARLKVKLIRPQIIGQLEMGVQFSKKRETYLKMI